VTTVASLEALVRPQVNLWLAGVQGNSPLWVVSFRLRGSTYWQFVTTRRPGSNAPVTYTELSPGGLYGVTSLGQIGPVHDVALARSRAGAWTATVGSRV
jgi:hypothetical protein